MELRQMPEIQNIAEYLRNMEFKKKAFGGCAVESVLEHFSAVTQQYESIISAYMLQAQKQAQQTAILQGQLKQKERELATATAKLQEVMQWGGHPSPSYQQPQMQTPQPAWPNQGYPQQGWGPQAQQQPPMQQTSFPAQQRSMQQPGLQPGMQQQYAQQQPQTSYNWQNEAEYQREPSYLYA